VSGAVTGQIRVADVQFGTRHRREMGDIDALAEDIAEIGLFHPIVVTPAGQLIAVSAGCSPFASSASSTFRQQS
jgi:hypothetical protein